LSMGQAAVVSDQLTAAAGMTSAEMDKLNYMVESLGGASGELTNGVMTVYDAFGHVISRTNSVADEMESAATSTNSFGAGVADLRTVIDQTGTVFADTTNAMARSVQTIGTMWDNLPSGHSQGGIVGYAGGGLLEGGSGRRDDLYLGTVNGRAQMAMGGEFIVNPRSTAKHLSDLYKINSDKFLDGGQVSGSSGRTLTREDITAIRQSSVNITYIPPPTEVSVYLDSGQISARVQQNIAESRSRGFSRQPA
jgi:hypothetical protein